MIKLVANMYTYIYDVMYNQSWMYDKLSVYSDAIMDTLTSSGTMHNAYLVVRALGIGLLIVYFLLALESRLAGRETSISVFFNTLIQFFISYFLILNSFNIVKWLFQLGDSLAAAVASMDAETAIEIATYSEILEESLSDMKLLTVVLYVLKAFLPFLGCVFSQIVITYVVVTRVLRICVNAVLSPIAMSNCFEDSRRAEAMKFIKKTLAMCLQCSAIMIISVAVGNLAVYMQSNDVYKDGMTSSSSIETAVNDMLATSTVNTQNLILDVDEATEKLGISVREKEGGKWKLIDNYDEANLTLKSYQKSGESLIKKDFNESLYKECEKALDIQIFERDANDNYIYVGYADGTKEPLLKSRYLMFKSTETTAFLDTLLAGGSLVVMLILLAVKVGLIKQSMSICNTIVGV